MNSMKHFTSPWINQNNNMRLKWIFTKCVPIIIAVVLAVMTFHLTLQWHQGTDGPTGRGVFFKNGNIQRGDHNLDLQLPKRKHTSNKWLLIHEQDPDVCLELSKQYPSWTIVIMGALSRGKEPCEYYAIGAQWSASLQQGIIKYAIQEGAETIYIASDPSDDGIVPLYPKGPYQQARTIMYKSSEPKGTLFDPVYTWGCGPYERQNKKQFKATYSICMNVKVGIETTITETTTSGVQGNVVHTSCDNTSPPIVLHSGTYTTIQPKRTLLHSHAFWAIPVLYSDDSVRLEYSALIQKIMWLTGSHVKVNTFRDLHKTSNQTALKLQTFLDSYSCPQNLTVLPGCANALIKELYREKLVPQGTFSFLVDWFEILQKINYQFPPVAPVKQLSCSERLLRQYFGEESRSTPSAKAAIKNEAISQQKHKEMCADHSQKDIDLSTSSVSEWNDVLLVITFNNPLYKSIPYLEILYRKIFPHILYCAPNEGKPPSEEPYLKNYDLTFVHYRATPKGALKGTYFYECLVLAAALNYDIRGYYIVADDVLMVPKHMENYNRDNIWYNPLKNHIFSNYDTRTHVNIGTKRTMPLKSFAPFPQYEKVNKIIMKKIQELTSENGRHCVQRLINITGTADRPLASFPDAWYVSACKIDAVSEIMNVFLDNEGYLAIAIGTALSCVSEPTDYTDLQTIYATGMGVFNLPGLMKPGQDRYSPWEFIKPDNINKNDLMHPYKLSFVHKGVSKHVHYFCRYLDYLHDPAGKFVL